MTTNDNPTNPLRSAIDRAVANADAKIDSAAVTQEAAKQLDAAIAEAGVEAGTNQAAADMRNRLDGLLNEMTGMGTSRSRAHYDRWKIQAGSVNPEVLTDMFRHDDMTRRLCELKPNEAVRKGFQSGNPDVTDVIGQWDLAQVVQEALIWEGVYGGSAIIIGARDEASVATQGRSMAEPLGANVQQIDWIRVVDKTHLTAIGSIVTDCTSPYFGQPDVYNLTLSTEAFPIHRSRMVILGGALTPVDTRIANGYWGDSVIERALNTILDFARAFGGVSQMLSEANQGVMYIDGLINSLSEADPTPMAKRMKLMNLLRGIAGLLVLDKDEKFEQHELSFSGIAVVLDRLMIRLAAAFDIPFVKLFGRSPAGLNATGESDTRMWYDSVATYQRNKVAPIIKQVLAILLLAKKGVTRGNIPEYDITFNQLWEMTATETATHRKTVAETDKLYIEMGAYTAEECALARFDPNGSFNADRFLVNHAELLQFVGPELGGTAGVDASKGAGAAGSESGSELSLELSVTDVPVIASLREARKSKKLTGTWYRPEELDMPVALLKAKQLAEAAAAAGGAPPDDLPDDPPDGPPNDAPAPAPVGGGNGPPQA